MGMGQWSIAAIHNTTVAFESAVVRAEVIVNDDWPGRGSGQGSFVGRGVLVGTGVLVGGTGVLVGTGVAVGAGPPMEQPINNVMITISHSQRGNLTFLILPPWKKDLGWVSLSTQLKLV